MAGNHSKMAKPPKRQLGAMHISILAISGRPLKKLPIVGCVVMPRRRGGIRSILGLNDVRIKPLLVEYLGELSGLD